MKIKHGVLKINPELDNSELALLATKIAKHIDEIKKIKVDITLMPASSALFALLASIKKNNNDILIPALDQDVSFSGLGDIVFMPKGL